MGAGCTIWQLAKNALPSPVGFVAGQAASGLLNWADRKKARWVVISNASPTH